MKCPFPEGHFSLSELVNGTSGRLRHEMLGNYTNGKIFVWLINRNLIIHLTS